MTPRWSRVPAIASAAVVLPLVWCAPAAAEIVGGRTVLSVGHVDAMQVYMDGDQLDLRVKDDTGDATRYHDPEDVLFQVLPEAEMPIPEGETWNFIGDAGESMWMLPLTQDPALLWPGWSTEPLAKGQFEGDEVALELVDVDGPGEVVLWTVKSFGEPVVFASSRDGLPDAIPVGVPAHVHSFWAFTAEGAYTLTWRASGDLADGTPVASEEIEYRWQVGEAAEEPEPELPDASDLEGRLVLDEGHVDVLSVDDTAAGLDLRAKDGTRLHDSGDVYRDPDEVVFHATTASETVLGEQFAGPGYDQVGAPGDVRWLLPDTQRPGVLFAGWDTDAIPKGVLAGDAVDLALTGFSGPGELVMLTVDDFGDAIVQIDTADALPQAITTTARTHAHVNWFFSEPGIYRLTWQAEAEAADGAPLVSAPQDYLFVVGEWPEDDDPDPDPDPNLENTQAITAELDADTGGLVLSVDPEDRTVALPAMTLAADATRWTTEGELRPVTVTDTRSADPGWNATAQVSDFSLAGQGQGADGEDQVPGSCLGWTPSLTSKGAEQNVTPGPPVQGLLDGGPGLAASQLLASAAPGAGNGTAVLQADLHLDLPTDVESGTYTALVTFTAI